MDRFQNTGQPDWDWWSRLWPTPGATLRKPGLTSGESVAEVGCGSGYFALPAARIAEPESVYAIDLDASLLNELDGLADQQDIEYVVPIHGDARKLTEVLPEPVTTLVVANTFHGVDDQSGLVEQAFDAIESGGRLIVVNWHERPRETTTVGENGDELREALDTLLALQRSGTLDELAELAEVGSLATAALDDEMVTSLAGTGAALGEVAQTASDDDARDGIERLLESVGEAERNSPDQVGAVGLLRGLRDPNVQYGLGYLLALAGALGRVQNTEESR